MDIWLQLILLVILIFINGFFAASEMAIVSSNRLVIEEEADKGRKKAKTLLKLLDDESKFLSTIQVVITLAGMFSASSAAVQLAVPVGRLFEKLGTSVNAGYTIAIVVLTILVAFFNLVFGELVPKRVALIKKEKLAIAVAPVIMFFKVILTPFVWLLSGTTNLVLRVFGYKRHEEEGEFTKEEMKRLLKAGKASGSLSDNESKMIASVFMLEQFDASDIMTPRKLVYAIDVDDDIKKIIDEYIENGYSRVPVYEKDIDNIIGILYNKDLLRALKNKGNHNINLKEILRPVYFVSETMKADKMFQEMQHNHSYIAIVIDEFGGFSGIVTLEDLVEEIVGNIYDEDDQSDIRLVAEDTYLTKGIVPIQDINRTLDVEIPISTDDSYDSVGGLLIYLLERLPNEEDKNKTLEFANLEFKIIDVKKNTINKVQIKILKQENIEEED